jgi:hypothetical protein
LFCDCPVVIRIEPGFSTFVSDEGYILGRTIKALA